ncbi:MAG: transcription antitermination factor NusB [Gammaproteobacteria bacterium]|nr:transcription antitermination factor NusB [Gammaproteobacteria bacterium]
MSEPAKKKKLSSRTRSRRLAMQAIYQWLMSGDAPVNDIEKQFAEDQEMQSANAEYFSELLQGAVAKRNELSGLMAPHLSRPFDEIDPVEQSVLLIAAYEFKYVPSVPYRAVINEAIELTKVYGAEAAHKFINGVLDKLANDLRSVEKNT